MYIYLRFTLGWNSVHTIYIFHVKVRFVTLKLLSEIRLLNYGPINSNSKNYTIKLTI